MNNVYLQLGTNMGDRLENLCQSIVLITVEVVFNVQGLRYFLIAQGAHPLRGSPATI